VYDTTEGESCPRVVDSITQLSPITQFLSIS
jgi:hypothetical protein